MSEVPRQARLIRRSSGFTYRVRVPTDLREVIGKREIWKSLGAVPLRDAERKASEASVETDRLFASARAALADRSKPTPLASFATHAAIVQAARSYLHRLETSADVVPFDEAARLERLDRAIEDAAGIHGLPAHEPWVERTALEVAKAARLDVNLDDGGAAFRELVGALKRAADEHASRTVHRMALQRVANTDPTFAGIADGVPLPKVLTFGDAIEAFLADPGRSGLSPKTLKAYRRRFDAWLDLLGIHTPIASITRARVKDARDILLTVPPSASKKWPGMSLREVAAMAVRDGLSPLAPKSLRHSIDGIATLFRWLHREGEIANNPAGSLGAPPPATERSRRPLTADELRHLFRSGVYADKRASRDWRFWAPLIGVFMGLRINEIAGLDAADVAERDGVPVLIVRPNTARGLKNKQSARVVPVHPELVRLGLLVFAGGLRADGPLFILPDAKHPAEAAQKAMAYTFKKVFPDDRRVVFHGLRHTWADACRDAYISRDVIERMGGWKTGGSAFSGYGAGHRPSLLASEIAKVRYLGLDLEHLAPEGAVLDKG